MALYIYKSKRLKVKRLILTSLRFFNKMMLKLSTQMTQMLQINTDF